MPIYPFQEKNPQLGEGVFLAPSAVLTGDIEVADHVSFWFHTVARGDVNWIRIGAGSNIQDGSVLHVSYRQYALTIGERVTVGHGAIVHGCTLEDRSLVGMGATILDGAVVESQAQVGAGALVPPGKRIPAGHLAVGVPAKVVRPLTPEELEKNAEGVDRYQSLKEDYRAILGSGY